MDFFINRPIFASVIALVMVIAGAIAALALPVAQYPEIVPPQVQVSTTYIGAGSDVVSESTTTPLEEQINGAAGMIYMSSVSTNNGDSVITCTFEIGFDQNDAQMEVLSRTNQALSELPQEVRQVGLTIEKKTSNIMLVVSLTSPNGTYDQQFLGNYADIHVYDALYRIPGVGQINNFGLQKYAIRVWVDPAKLSTMKLTAGDVVNAIEEQNQQVAAGKTGQPPAPGSTAFEYQLSTLGRLDQVSQFEDIVVRAEPDGSVVRIEDVARVEMGSEEYNWSVNLSGKPTGALGVYQLADANALHIKQQVVEKMTELEKHFPEDMTWEIPYDTTRFVRESVSEVFTTLWQAILLVFLVVYVFLQSLRTTLIPAITIPVSLVGTLAIMLALGFSLNTLSLLGLVLAVGLVVDDAIVVVENVERKLGEDSGRSLREVTREAMAEVRGPIVATTLSLLAVFVPVAFMPGMTGQLYNQFALTIAISVGLSGINSLTLSPALCAILLRRRTGQRNILFRAFNRTFDAISAGYAQSVKVLAKVWLLVLIGFVALCIGTLTLFKQIPTAFAPAEDQGYFLILFELPEASTIDRTEAVSEQVSKVVLATPGVDNVVMINGYNLIQGFQDPSAGFAWINLKPWDERQAPGMDAMSLIPKLQREVAGIPEARAIVVNAPAIPGLSQTGGFQFEIQDRLALGAGPLSEAAEAFMAAARKRPELRGVFSTYTASVPGRNLEVDRLKAKALGVSLDDLFDTLQINLGSKYVNQFNKYGRVYRTYVQAESSARASADDIGRLKVRNQFGHMIDLHTLVKVHDDTGPYSIPHYNLYHSVQVNGGPSPGHSSGQAIQAMEEVAEQVLPEGFGYEWTGVTYQQKKAGNLAPVIFALSLIFVFLVLAAQYESWTLPVMVVLAVPLGLLGAVGALLLRGMDLNVYAQIGLVMLIGLAAKNAILIVEFAKDERSGGKSILEAAMNAARIRLRPILMTAFAFILGVMPLALATGAGANARQSMGTTVIGGMLASTILIVFVPVFYFVIQHLREWTGYGKPASATGDGGGGGAAEPDNEPEQEQS